MKTQYIAVLGLMVVFIGSQLLHENVYPYILFPTLLLLIITVVKKIKLERTTSRFEVSRYLLMFIAVLVSAGIFIYYYYFSIL